MVASGMLLRSGLHLPACTTVCGKLHCPCGKDAQHGSKTCGSSLCGIAYCRACDDTCACKIHVDRKVFCQRCSGTGAFITGLLNGNYVTRGSCFRCGGKGHTTKDDRKRNRGFEATRRG